MKHRFSGWSPRKLPEGGSTRGDRDAVIHAISPEMHARLGGVETGGRQDNVSGWSRRKNLAAEQGSVTDDDHTTGLSYKT